METWVCFLIGWGVFVLLIYLHFCLDFMYYYSKWPNKLRKIYRALTEE